MADELDGHRVDPGVARQLAQGELGQLPVVAGRQVSADVEDLGRDEMEVVEEPIRSGGDERPAVDVLGHGDIGLPQHPRVVLEARQHVARGAPGIGMKGETGGQGPRPLLEPLDAQELVAKGPIHGRRRGPP